MKPLLILMLLIWFSLPWPTLAAAVDARNYSGPAWSPYVAGSGIGLLLCFAMYFSNKPLGASSAYATISGLLGKIVAPHRTRDTKYFKENPPRADWELLFVLATVIGAFCAAFNGDELTKQWLHPMWSDRFGEESLWLRAIVGLAGGILMAFGARLAKGCTSGHGISGAAQLNVASWIALVCFFVGGTAIANLLF